MRSHGNIEMTGDLIARLEKATGPDCELLWECYHTVFRSMQINDEPEQWKRFQRLLNAEAWTDAALMLFPDGYAWELNSDGSVVVGSEPAPGRLLEGIICEAATPALAICIAALKAREHGKT